MTPPRRPLDSISRGRPSRATSAFEAWRSWKRSVADDSPAAAGVAVEHPRLRRECVDGPRPCPLVGCFYNNYLEVRRRQDSTPEIKILHPGRLPEDVPPEDSCTLDLADAGPHTLERVADVYGLTRERIRQVEVSALKKIMRAIKNEDDEEEARSATYQKEKP